jgi:hypothetical protein
MFPLHMRGPYNLEIAYREMAGTSSSSSIGCSKDPILSPLVVGSSSVVTISSQKIFALWWPGTYFSSQLKDKAFSWGCTNGTVIYS